MSKISVIRQFGAFLNQRRKWWLYPVALMLLLIGALLVFTQGSAVAPFIYALF
jgi:hypothetical protein